MSIDPACQRLQNECSVENESTYVAQTIHLRIDVNLALSEREHLRRFSEHNGTSIREQSVQSLLQGCLQRHSNWPICATQLIPATGTPLTALQKCNADEYEHQHTLT